MSIKIKGLNGEEITLGQFELDSLRGALRGELLEPSGPEFSKACQIWNGMIKKKPALIAQCSGTADVIVAVRFARDNKLLLSVKGGGHNIAGSALCDGGLMIDLSLMRSVRVDVNNRSAFVQGGALLGDLDHETQSFGLAVSTGINSTTGLAGLALGGGYGWLSRTFGHTVDNIMSADIVTPDGKLLHLSENENSDLFWAIRGGGGNFGIVTHFEFRLHKVGPMILCGPVIYPIEQAKGVLEQYREIVPEMPDEASCWTIVRKAPPFPFLDAQYHGQPVLVLVMAYIGDITEGEKVLTPLRTLGTPLADAVGPQPYTDWQATFDGLLAAGAQNYWKSSDFTHFPDELVDIMVNAPDNMPSDECEIFVAQLGGKAGRVASDAMAYPHRNTKFTMNIHGRWQSPELNESGIAWVRKTYEQAERHATGSVYINFEPEQGENRKIGPYGANRQRLEAIKQEVDPNNLFRTNINIQGAKS